MFEYSLIFFGGGASGPSAADVRRQKEEEAKAKKLEEEAALKLEADKKVMEQRKYGRKQTLGTEEDVWFKAIIPGRNQP